LCSAAVKRRASSGQRSVLLYAVPCHCCCRYGASWQRAYVRCFCNSVGAACGARQLPAPGCWRVKVLLLRVCPASAQPKIIQPAATSCATRGGWSGGRTKERRGRTSSRVRAMPHPCPADFIFTTLTQFIRTFSRAATRTVMLAAACGRGDAPPFDQPGAGTREELWRRKSVRRFLRWK